jgi:hypothetical protein
MVRAVVAVVATVKSRLPSVPPETEAIVRIANEVAAAATTTPNDGRVRRVKKPRP